MMQYYFPFVLLPDNHSGEIKIVKACRYRTCLPLSPSVNLLLRSDLQPSSIRGLATPWTYFLHLSLSSVILTDSSTESHLHVLMLSIQAVRALPRLRAPGVVPSIISFSRQLPCFLTV